MGYHAVGNLDLSMTLMCGKGPTWASDNGGRCGERYCKMATEIWPDIPLFQDTGELKI